MHRRNGAPREAAGYNRGPMRYLVVLALLSMSLGCGPAAAEPTSTGEPTAEPAPAAEPTGTAEPATGTTAEPAAEPGAEAPTDEATGGETGTATGASICERARACCRAYVEAIPSARRPLEERGCTEMDAVLAEAGEAADDACDAAIGGWRQSLQLTGIEVPEACR